MARRKNAAALFEVIHSDNRFTARHQPGSWSLRPPGWFSRMFRRRPSDGPAPVETIDYAASEPAAPRGPSLLARLFALMPAMPRIGMSLDAERQLVRFQLSYTGALISAFALVVAIGLAYMAGRGAGPRPMPALTDQTTEELRQGPTFADVLDVGDDATSPPVAMAAAPTATAATPLAQPAQTATTATGRTTASRSTVATAQQPATGSQVLRPSQFNEPKPPATYMVSDANRTVGLQYVIIQSYPDEEKGLAESAMQMLNQNGVLCTVERNLPYAPGWICVVGITGFARTKDVPEYEAYTNRILQLSSQFAGTSKFKKFEPKPFRWREMKSTAASDKPAAATSAPKGPTLKQ